MKEMRSDVTTIGTKIDERALADSERRVEESARGLRLFIGVVVSVVVGLVNIIIPYMRPH